jgi:catechol 2,3-dioxygenase-like lactoylglutathione lyase family enzyme
LQAGILNPFTVKVISSLSLMNRNRTIARTFIALPSHTFNIQKPYANSAIRKVGSFFCISSKEIHMLDSKEAIATIAVKDLQVAARFYEDKLGLRQHSSMGEEVITYRCGTTRFNVYRSQYAGSNQATALMWAVGKEIETIVRTLKGKGVVFEHYDIPGLTLKGDVHVGGDMQVAWFKDPDGNILSIANG